MTGYVLCWLITQLCAGMSFPLGCAQVNRLAGLAVMLHCFLPGSWVPPLQTPSAMPEVQSNGEQDASTVLTWRC
jgi:hypothetical protein